NHFIQVAIAVDRRLPRVARALDVAAVDHVDAARRQRLDQPGHTQRFGPHAGATGAGADVGGRADDRYGGIAAAHGGSVLVRAPASPGGTAGGDGASVPARWCRHPGSNWGPTAYKAVALPTELCRQVARRWKLRRRVVRHAAGRHSSARRRPAWPRCRRNRPVPPALPPAPGRRRRPAGWHWPRRSSAWAAVP